jgi:hypothetical protein
MPSISKALETPTPVGTAAVPAVFAMKELAAMVPRAPPEAAMVTPPEEFVIVMFEPAESVFAL